MANRAILWISLSKLKEQLQGLEGKKKINSAVAVQRDILKSLMNKSYFCLKRGCSLLPPSLFSKVLTKKHEWEWHYQKVPVRT